MPWLKLVLRIGRLKLLRGPVGEYYLQWGKGHLRRVPTWRRRRLAH